MYDCLMDGLKRDCNTTFKKTQLIYKDALVYIP